MLPPTVAFTTPRLPAAHAAMDGLANKQIARQLAISHHTVSNAIGRIFLKTDCQCRTQLAVWAIKQLYETDGRADPQAH